MEILENTRNQLVTTISEHYKRYVNYISGKTTLKKRIMFSFSALIFIALSTIGLVSYKWFSSYVQDMIIDQKMKNGRSVIEEINNVKERDEKTSDQLLLNRYIQEDLRNSVYQDDYDKFSRTKLLNSLLYSIVDDNNVVSIYIACNNGLDYKSNPDEMISINEDSQWEDSIVYKEAINGKGKNIWLPMVRNIFQVPFAPKIKEQPYLYIVREMRYLDNTRKTIGISVVQLSYYRLHNILDRIATSDNEYSVLVDSDGTIIAHTTQVSLIGSNFNLAIMRKAYNAKEGYFFMGDDKDKKLILYNKYPNLEWFIIQVIPYENITKKSREIGIFTIIIMIICLSISIIISNLFSEKITTPIINLKNIMDQFGEGQLMVRANTNRNDEIGYLEKSFNRMADDIISLMNKIEDENKRSRKLELNMLEYQINPHFLYNTLDSINWMAQKSGQEDISKMVTALARFFRIGLSRGQDFIKLQDELAHAQAYLDISKIRYKDCFRFELDVEEKILDCKIIKIVLQPLLENAMKHGLYKDKTDGFIQIKGGIDQGLIRLEVKDNGRGIQNNRLKWLQNTLAGNCNDIDGLGFGLINVNERIKLNFGAEYGINIDSQIDRGTTVVIRIPIIVC